MGEQRVSLVTDQDQMHYFVKNLLQDVEALKYMLDNDWFEKGITRIGAEQEMCLVNKNTFKPACIAMQALDGMKDLKWVETELAKFNLEINLDPHEFTKDCLSILENEINTKLNKMRRRLKKLDAKIILTGILPTLRKFDLSMNNLTPKKRYFALMEAINSQLESSAYELKLDGIDELQFKHDSPLIEACNTSFQVHLQVSPEEFVKMYNIAQTLAAPIMAIAANSSLVFGKRLWHESRIALFQQALDTRSSKEYMREKSPRVSFGNDWLNDSILEIYKEDIARFRVLLSSDVKENALDKIANNEVPNLRALQVHNSTVYRWNRPCYGISPNGKPHLRIENRVLPAGPTVLDEVSNAAFWLGMMKGMADEITDIRDHISFEDIHDNFNKAARFGIDSKFTWMNNEKISAVQLITERLLPLSKKGLKSVGIKNKDINRYLKVIEDRTRNHSTGARWLLRSFTKLSKETSIDEAVTTITSATIQNQEQEIPVHQWKLPELGDLKKYKPSDLRVEEFMIKDLFTVQKDDIIELVADMMDWRKIRYTAVESKKGELVGLVTSRDMLRHFAKCAKGVIPNEEPTTVKSLMIEDPIVISPEATIIEALKIMRRKKIGCLPVVQGKELIGMITEKQFLKISGRLIERLKLEENKKDK